MTKVRLYLQNSTHTTQRENSVHNSPFIEVETLSEQQKLLLSLEKEAPCSADSSLFGVFTDVSEVQVLFLEVVSKAHVVEVGRDVNERVGHDGITVLGQNFVDEKLKPQFKKKTVLIRVKLQLSNTGMSSDRNIIKQQTAKDFHYIFLVST